ELPVQGVTEHAGELRVAAEVGEPVPGVPARDADHHAVAAGRARCEDRLRAGGQVLVQDDVAGRVEDAPVAGPGVQGDLAVAAVVRGVDAPGPGLRWGGRS